MPIVYLILGGNQGNRNEIISEAIDLVTSQIGIQTDSSSRYESESWGFKSEPFINQIIVLNTDLNPEEILEKIHSIEDQLGRTRKTNQYEARTIDIDLLYMDSRVINSTNLVVPHPRIASRRFVLLPLAEIAPELLDPVTGKTVAEMLDLCSDTSCVRRLGSTATGC
jgi:2-amino-4-hydroxy-6-hydroxymethyldihydropteridine diphosphokinase